MVFNRQWFLKNQKLLKWFANTNYGKGVLGHGLEGVDLILPNSVYQKQGNKVKAEFRTHDKYAKRLFYEYKPIWKAFHWFDMNVANTFVPKLNLGFDTLTAYPDTGTGSTTCDSRLEHADGTGQSFTTLVNAAGNYVDASSASTIAAYFQAHTVSNEFIGLSRSGYTFDTSSLDSLAESVDSAVFSIYGASKSDGLSATPNSNIYSFAPADDATHVAGDFDSMGTTAYCDTAITYAGFNTSGYNDWTLNATGLAAVSTSGNTKIGFRNANHDVADSAPSWSSSAISNLNAYFADQAGTTNDPKLVVTYTPGATGNAIMFGANF